MNLKKILRNVERPPGQNNQLELLFPKHAKYFHTISILGNEMNVTFDSVDVDDFISGGRLTVYLPERRSTGPVVENHWTYA